MRELKRKLTQLFFAVLYNCNFKGFAAGSIYQGNAKNFCVPGLNCYSCPGAVGACPLGSFQSALAASRYKLPYYMMGVMVLFGLALGRVICGFLCPFGLIQELLYKIPGRKISKSRGTAVMSRMKYVVLAVFVIGIPLIAAAPGFCKYICPAGTLEAGLPLVLKNTMLKELAGGLFVWKVGLMLVILISAIFLFRSFCRFLCPLGAWYSLFHNTALVGYRVDAGKCTSCGRCITGCKMDIRHVGDAECIQCGECVEMCPEDAIAFMLGERYNKTTSDSKERRR